jgi:hypothetical protein
MLGHTLSKMFDNPIISFYVTKKGASFLTPLIVGLIKHGPSSESLRLKKLAL